METMVANGGHIPGGSEWVAFDQSKSGGDGSFDAIGRSKANNRPPVRRAESARRHTGNADTSSVSSWMKKPINSDSSWAPVAPPKTSVPNVEHPVANKYRPPRIRTGAVNSTADSGSLRGQRSSNPVSSSDSSSSSADRGATRGRSVQRTSSSKNIASGASASSATRRDSSSHRGRSRSRGPTDSGDALSRQSGEHGSSRDRSSSRTRSVTRDRSTSVSRRQSASGRGSSRPPPTSSSRRSRSNSRTPVTRSRSTSRSRAPKPPPSTSRTRREMRTIPTSSSHSVGPGLPSGRKSSSNHSVTSEPDDQIGRNISFGRTKCLTPTGASGKRSGLMEKLFGDQVSEEAKQSYASRAEPSPTGSVSSHLSWHQPDHIHSRILLTATVYHNTATNLWIATINTNQKGVAKNPTTASKYLKAFSFTSEREARESAIANAPPKMMSFEENSVCFICRGKFAMFRRATNCRNCGVVICNPCSTIWTAKMVPETYNLKKESQLRVCKSCNHLSGAFKKALLDGDYEEAVALYGSGNINLRTPFPQSTKKKEEIMYPIHAAVEGGNIDIVRWLMEDHYCPIKVIRTGAGRKPKRGGSPDQPILTSKGRSVLTIAMVGLHVDILRYLVVDNGVSIYESKDLKGSLRALEAVLLAIPGHSGDHHVDSVVHRWDDRSFDGDSVASSLGADQTIGGDDGTLGSKKKHSDSCIICYDNVIDCVMTPCGHQVCCLGCSKNLSACPVCNIRGEFIKIFRP